MKTNTANQITMLLCYCNPKATYIPTKKLQKMQSNPQALSINLALPSSPANLATLALSSTQASPVETWRLFATLPFPPHEAPIDYPVARGAIETPNRLRSQVVTTTRDTLMHLRPPAPSKIALVPTRPTSGLQAGAALTEQANHQMEHY
ncbi:hypothetical protein PCASD_23392 [Puccinia coronata f. sp. avenae]|uniref:Uncharacterized protein n=1 Tax=Puccinia coronata f. sp. avenae TaxID=200324 RepID=A0A2N5SK99_9BASI|nr:hypothetical protein PCASD_23392 [Puccinia coronata f. sp. avenae]